VGKEQSARVTRTLIPRIAGDDGSCLRPLQMLALSHWTEAYHFLFCQAVNHHDGELSKAMSRRNSVLSLLIVKRGDSSVSYSSYHSGKKSIQKALFAAQVARKFPSNFHLSRAPSAAIFTPTLSEELCDLLLGMSSHMASEDVLCMILA
jgi:hypothetical protein